MRKKAFSLALAGVLCAANTAAAVDFKVSGEWLTGFGGVESSMRKDKNGGRDVFQALQRFDLELEAVVSESLAGVLGVRIGDVNWGKAEDGGALGTDGTIVKVHSAYLNWRVPATELTLQMGLQGVALPNAAGGSAVLDEQTAAVIANYKFNDTVGLTAFWLRPFNDNYTYANGYTASRKGATGASSNYLDNADYFGLSVPVTLEGVELTPWFMVGAVGKNALGALDADGENAGPDMFGSLPLPLALGNVQEASWTPAGHAYRTEWYAGLPLVLGLFDPLSIELDITYGYASGVGRYTVEDRNGVTRRGGTERQGWLVKALAEYKMDWGTPGLFGWYASGDDGNLKNGSERLPTLAPSSNFTSFMQDGENGWSLDGGYDLMLNYGGTWGVGVQIKDVSFVENLTHTVRVAYWGGTNSESMIKYTAGGGDWRNDGGVYLTTKDHLVECNLDTTWQVYENLAAVVELGYIFNGVDRSAWNKNAAEPMPQKADAWKAALVMKYTF